MPIKPLLSALCLLLPALGCAGEDAEPPPPSEAENAAGAPAGEPTPPIEPIVARGAFATDAERRRFEAEVLPSARAFLAYWKNAGLTVPHEPARLFISAPSGTRASEALPKLYGEGVFEHLRTLEADVASAASNREGIDRIDAFTCAHPPLHRGFLQSVEKHADNPAVGPGDIARALHDEHEELLGPEGTFSFRADNGEFELPRRRNCSYTLLGHSTEPTRAHPYLERDVVNHELGHALHYGLWLSSGPLGESLSTSANEAIADILAHVFDGDPRHGKVLNEQGAPVGCRRRMDVYDSSVSDAFWKFGRADHGTGQALRQMIWSLREEVAPEALQAAIVEGIAAVQTALNRVAEEPLANVPLFDDEILAVRNRFVREYEASGAFFDGVCSRVGGAATACRERQERIGDPRLEMRAGWLASSPTAIGESGVTLPDGRRVAFELEGALIRRMVITRTDGARQVYSGDAELGFPEATRDPESGRVTLWFLALDDAAQDPTAPGAQLGWTSDGALTTG